MQSYDAASRDLRCANGLLDGIFAMIPAFPIWFIVAFLTTVLGIVDAPFWKSLANPAGEGFIVGVSFFLYYFLCESLWQRTLAKRITGTKVVTLDGTKPTYKVIAIRTLVRLVPFEWLSFFSKTPGGWHDKWSGTMVVRTEAAQDPKPQPVSSPTESAGLSARHVGLHSWESMGQEASVPEPIHIAVAMSESTSTTDAARRAPCAQGRGPGWNTKWLALAVPIVVVLGALMVWSANKPVPSASASEAVDQTDHAYVPPSSSPVPVPPSAPSAVAPRSTPRRSVPRSAPRDSVPRSEPWGSVARSEPWDSVPKSEPWDSVPRSAPSDSDPPSSAWVSFPPPPPGSASAPGGLPSTIHVDAVVTVDGKTVVFSDIGELTQGRTVSGWKVTRITGREIVLKKGETVHTYLMSSSGGN